MELFLKVTAGLLLLAQAFQSVSLQQSTDSPGRTIDKSWLRDLVRNRTGHQAGFPSAGTEPDQGFDLTLDSSHDYSGGITSGSMPILNEEESIKDADEEREDQNVVTTPELPGDMATQDPFLDVNVSATTLDSTNVTDVEKDIKNSTATSLLSKSTVFPTAENSTRLSDFNQNNSLTTLAPEGNATQETATTPTEDTRLINLTEPTDTRTTKVSQTSTTSVPATSFQPSMSSEMSLKTTISPVQDTPEVANKTGTGSSSERGRSPFHLSAIWYHFRTDTTHLPKPFVIQYKQILRKNALKRSWWFLSPFTLPLSHMCLHLFPTLRGQMLVLSKEKVGLSFRCSQCCQHK